MAFRNLQVAITANSSSLRNQLMLASRQLDQFGKKAESAGDGAVRGFGKIKIAIAASGVAVAAGLAYAGKAAAEFETRMRNVNSISGLSEKALAGLGKEVLGLSKVLPQSANNLAEGLYDVASSGFQGSEGLLVLKSSAEAASAGLSTTAVAAKGITAVLNAYGLGAGEARDVSDALFQTVNLGVLTFEELASNIGDVVGTAAAAGVSIGEVGAAIAAMTLAGISAAESSTSLNRVIQSVIQPSDALAMVLQSVGYESGTQAIEVDGLRGVMEKLRVTTGGNVESLLQLFPEIRAARGAFALMSASGENYKKTSDGIADADKRQGATRKALKEQMKAVSAQFQLFTNRLNAGAITLGGKLLPVFLQAMKAAERFGNQGLAVIGDVLQRLAPFFKNVGLAAKDVAEILTELASNAAPVVKVLLAVAGAAILGGLQAVAAAVRSVTSFMADHQGVVAGLATALTVLLIPALVRTAVSLGVSAFWMASKALAAVGGAAGAAGRSMAMLGVAGSAAGVALAASVGLVVSAYTKAERKAKESVAAIVDEMDSSSLEGLQATYGELVQQEQALLRTGEAAGGWGNAFKAAYQVMGPAKNKIVDVREEIDRTRASIDAIDKLKGNALGNITAITKELGIPKEDMRSWNELRPQIEKTAKTLGVDLTKSVANNKIGIIEVAAEIKKWQASIGLAGGALKKATGVDLVAMEQLAAAVDEVTSATRKAFMASGDLFANFDADLEGGGAKAVAEARGELAEARRDLSDLEAKRSADKSISIADDQSLRDAREGVAEATRNVAKAEGGVVSSRSQIERFYTSQIQSARQFMGDLTQAAQMGLNPAFIQRALTEGPEKAGPILQALVSDHSGRLIAMVNESEAAMAKITAQAAELARLTTLATNARTGQFTKDLPSALGISTQIAAGNDTIAGIAGKLKIPESEVKRISDEFGILGVRFGNATRMGFISGLGGDWASMLTARANGGSAAGSNQRAQVRGPSGNFGRREFGAVDYKMARGGALTAHVTHTPTVLYGERSTGGEAFIPLGRQHRTRSTALVREVASAFGMQTMATGGIMRPAGGSRGPNLEIAFEAALTRALESVQRQSRPINQTFNERVEPRQVGRAVARAL